MVAILGDGILIDQLTRTHNDNQVVKTLQTNQTIETQWQYFTIHKLSFFHRATINSQHFYLSDNAAIINLPRRDILFENCTGMIKRMRISSYHSEVEKKGFTLNSVRRF